MGASAGSASSSAEPLPADEERLQELVVAVLARIDVDGDAALEEVCRLEPALAVALRRRIARLSQAGLIGALPSDEPSFPERLGPYRLVRRIGGGGMGVVYEALEEKLGRTVALKLVRPESLYFEGARERFAREVGIVARLQHPGIVPVHAFGDEGGVPYFSMELVRGCTLAEALKELAGRRASELRADDLALAVRRAAPAGGEAPAEHASPLFAGSWEEACLRVVREVAEALEHAHRRGVLHRDVKPSNVMLTPAGRVLLVDFGLARSEGSAELTRSQAQVGSLAYMAPEQLEGGAARLDRRADVYGLGVLLYELLCLRPPYRAETASELVRAVHAGEPLPPRRLNPGLSWEAETACLTAMERERERRYASAADLARDLSNVLEHRPIEARRASARLRARRWAQRHPTLALGALLLVVGPTAFAVQSELASRDVHAANVQLGLALADARAERDRAEQNLQSAFEAVDQMLIRVSEGSLAMLPHAEPVRRQLLEDALAFYDRLSAQAANRPAVERERVHVLAARGRILDFLGRSAEADAALVEQIALARELLAHAPGDRYLREELAMGLGNLADLRGEAGRHADSLPLFEEGEVAYAALAADPGALPRHRRLVGVFRYKLAHALRELGRAEEASARLRAAIEVDEQLCADHPGEPQYEYALEAALALEGWWLLTENRLEEAAPRVERAHRLARRLVATDPEHDRFRAELVGAASLLAGLYQRQGRHEEADRAVLESLDAAEWLADRFPQVPEYRRKLGMGHVNRATSLASRGERAAAQEPFERGLAAFAELAADFPENPAYHRQLGQARGNRALLFMEDGRAEEACAELRLGLASLARAHELTPASPALRTEFARRWRQLAEFEGRSGHHAASAAAADEALALVRDDPTALRTLAVCLARCAGLARADEDLPADERAALSASYGERSLDLARRAIELGWRDAAEMRGAEEYAPLRALEGFESLVAAVEGAGEGG